jgi:hypothetical protein
MVVIDYLINILMFQLFQYLLSVDNALTIGGYTEARKTVIERAITIAVIYLSPVFNCLS